MAVSFASLASWLSLATFVGCAAAEGQADCGVVEKMCFSQERIEC
jgi:hypothetical protein